MLFGISEIEGPLQEGIWEAVANCKNASIHGDVYWRQWAHCLVDRAAMGGIILERPHMLLPDIMKAIVPQSQVLAWSLPDDK